MPTIKIKVDVDKFLRSTIVKIQEKRNLNQRKVNSNSIIKEALELLSKKEKLE